VFECVVNISEGRRPDVIDGLVAACGGIDEAALLDVHTDPDHHRSVFTLAGADAGAVLSIAVALTRAAVRAVDLSTQDGVHPRFGAVDVVPFVAYDEADDAGAIRVAHRFGTVVAAELALPVFFYDSADPSGRPLPEARREAFRTRPPDLGPPIPHPTAGGVAVGVRPVLVALNCELDAGAGVEHARAVAAAVRERNGGLPGVRALGFWLARRSRAQVSMNLVDLATTGVEAACDGVERQARQRGFGVSAIELVGLLPEEELSRCSTEFLARAGLRPELTVEARWRASHVSSGKHPRGPEGGSGSGAR
jgi:glutamate formiminotransferase